jgi:hypothetical protein
MFDEVIPPQVSLTGWVGRGTEILVPDQKEARSLGGGERVEHSGSCSDGR